MISIHNLFKTYKTSNTCIPVIRDVSLELPDTGLVFLLGKSGSGKTTMMNLLAGLDTPDKGEIIFNSNNIVHFNSKQADLYRNYDVGIVFQEYNLIESLNVRDNILLALELQHKEKNECQRLVDEMLRFVDLEGLESRKVTALSGGQRQRVAIARALIKRPQVIFADEPTGNLDSKTGKQVLQLLKKASEKRLIVIISHDEYSAVEFGDYIVRISDGIISIDCPNADNSRLAVTINNGEGEQLFYCKSTDELVLLLKDTLKTNSEFSLNVSRQVKPDDDLVSSNSADTSSLPSGSRQKKSSLPIKRKLFFACHNLSLSPIRSFFVVLLFAISLFLLMCVLHLSVFNRNTVVADYLEKYQIKCVFPYYLSEYENSYYNRYSKELTGGDYFISQIKQVLPDKEIVRSMALSDWNLSEQDFSAEEIYKRDILQYDINLFVKSSLWSENDLVYGKMPEDKYEIVVSDYLAKELFKSDNALGKHLVFWDNEMKIVGVLKTDYAEYRYKMKKTNNMDFAYTSFLGTHLYEIAIIDESLLDAYENSVNELSVLFADFFLSDNDSKYYSYKPLTYVPIGTLKDKEINLIAGREPQAENEIIISENYLFSSNFAAFSDKTDEELFDEILDKEFQFRNNFAENMDYYYTDSLNLYDFVKRVKVVGIVKNSYDDDGLRFDVAIADSIFNKMKSNYFSNFYASQIGVIINSGEERQIVDTIFNNGLRINEPSVRTICSFSDAKDSANSVLMIILFAIMCLTVLVLFSFINYSINSNYRQIGILRAVGTTGKDTLVIFALETGIITLTSLALSFAFDYMIMRYVNKLFMENLPINKFDIIVPNVILCVVTIIITICLALVSAALPIRTLSKKAPIDIIKGA